VIEIGSFVQTGLRDARHKLSCWELHICTRQRDSIEWKHHKTNTRTTILTLTSFCTSWHRQPMTTAGVPNKCQTRVLPALCPAQAEAARLSADTSPDFPVHYSQIIHRNLHETMHLTFTLIFNCKLTCIQISAIILHSTPWQHMPAIYQNPHGIT